MSIGASSGRWRRAWASRTACASCGLWVAESDANFVWVRLPEDVDDAVLVGGMRDRGVLVRAGGSLGRPGALRITVGTEHECDRGVRALGALI